MEQILSAEICQKCAECCKKHPYIELSSDEIEALQQATGLHRDAFTNPTGEAAEGYFLSFQDNGHCIFLNEDNGRYSCGVYEARPGICRDYPRTPKQEEACARAQVARVPRQP